MRKEGFINEKMLVKAVALSLVMGGVGFVANDALAAGPIPGMPSETDIMKANIQANSQRSVQNQKDIAGLKGDVATNKANIEKNAKDIATNKAIATKAYGMAQTEQFERNKADLQIREDMKKADKELSDKIDTNAKDIATNKGNIQQNANDISDNKVAIMKEEAARKGDIAMVDFKAKLEKEQREKADKNLSDRIDAEAKARKDADAMNSFMAGLEKQERENNDKKLDQKIEAEAKARKDADAMNSFMAGLEKQERENNDKKLDQKITDEAKARDFGDFKLNTKIDAEGQARVENDKILNGKIDAETDARKDADNKLSGRIDANKTAIDNEVVDRKAEVSRLDGRIDKLDANVEKVGAMAAAIANLHTMGYDPEAPTEIAVGVGQYRDKTGMALGAFHYPNRDFMLSFSVSTAGDEFMGGIGATWKFGRKSPEELRQAEAEKAAKAKLAKAEAAKKAAKDARVAAQQKRHAEMLAARTGK